MTPTNRVSDETACLASIQQHRDLVRAQLESVAHQLTERGRLHDLSKLREDELAGFARINRIARENPYGSQEYRDSLAQERPTIQLHYSRNSHHPEYHGDPKESRCCIGLEAAAEHMSLLDLIEMVCDWRGAYLGYGSQGTWGENIERQQERFAHWFALEQWWVILQVAAMLDPLTRAAMDPSLFPARRESRR
jgi:hypothetical protein